MSQASASSSPPPNATPFIAAITGRGNAATAFIERVELVEEDARVVERPGPPLLQIGARAERLVARAGEHQRAQVGAAAISPRQRAANASSSSATSARDSAFAAAGRLSVTNTAGPRRSTSRVSEVPAAGVPIPPDAITRSTAARRFAETSGLLGCPTRDARAGPSDRGVLRRHLRPDPRHHDSLPPPRRSVELARHLRGGQRDHADPRADRPGLHPLDLPRACSIIARHRAPAQPLVAVRLARPAALMLATWARASSSREPPTIRR